MSTFRGLCWSKGRLGANIYFLNRARERVFVVVVVIGAMDFLKVICFVETQIEYKRCVQKYVKKRKLKKYKLI